MLAVAGLPGGAKVGRTDFLFASPSFWTGAARTLDLWATLERYSYNISRTPADADAWAVENDWRVVGQDLKATLDALRAELKAA